jgi:hypothetical protein
VIAASIKFNDGVPHAGGTPVGRQKLWASQNKDTVAVKAAAASEAREYLSMSSSVDKWAHCTVTKIQGSFPHRQALN